MRMRKKKHGAERIAALSYLLATPQTLYAQRDNLQALFGNDHPVSLEIGCGKGSFIVELARRFPQRNFIAMERVSDVILTAMECCARAGLSNIRFLIADAQFLPDYFAPGSIQTIYLSALLQVYPSTMNKTSARLLFWAVGRFCMILF